MELLLSWWWSWWSNCDDTSCFTNTSGTKLPPWLPPDWLKTLVKSGNPVSVVFMADVSMATLPCPGVPQLLLGAPLGLCNCRLGEKQEEADSVLM